MIPKANLSNTAVIIPIYNAENHLDELFTKLREITENIITVNDGSTDKSGDICKDFNVIYYEFEENKGKGAAIKKGFEIALEKKFEFAITMDSDLQHNPKDIRKFFIRQMLTKADFIYGKRSFSPNKMPIPRIMSNFLTSLIVSFKTGENIYDSQSGFRLYNLNIIKKISINTARYQTETELILKFAKENAKFNFVPIDTVYGDEKSYISHWRDIKNFVKIIMEN